MDLNLDLGATGADAPADSTASSEPSVADSPAFEGQDAAATQETENQTAPETDASSLTTEPSEEDKIAALKQVAENPNTPQFARDKIKEALGYAGRLKEERDTVKNQFDELNTKYAPFEGKEAYQPEEIGRLKDLEQKLYDVQSFSATPETIDKFIKESNPAVYQDYQNQTVQKVLYKPDGTPDLDNWQFLIDKGVRYDPNNPDQQKVYAQDVLMAAEALRDGRIKRDDLHEFTTDAEYQSWVRKEQEAETYRQRNEEALQATRYQEEQIRTHELNFVSRDIKSQIEPQLQQSLERFKLNALPNEPKIATEFKQQIVKELNELFTDAQGSNRGLTEIKKALDYVARARGLKPVDAAAEVRGLLQNPQYKNQLNSGVTDYLNQADKLLAAKAYQLKLLMLGYAEENKRGANAREILGKPNQSAELPNLTAEQLAAMRGSERNNQAALRFTNKIRRSENGDDRLGG